MGKEDAFLIQRNVILASIWWIGCGAAFGQTGLDSAAAPDPKSDQAFFPKNWLRGYAGFEYAPNTNEVDLGRCLPSTGQFGGVNAPCAAFARYMPSGYVEMQPFGRTPLRHIFVFAAPRFFFGNNVPQVSYTQAATPIAYESSLGVGVELPKNFELRWTSHSVYWLGRYRNNLGPADLGTTGPYGAYSTVGVRWHFGSVRAYP